MSVHDLKPGDDAREIIARVKEAVPLPWCAVIVLARAEGKDGAEVLMGGARVSRAIAIKLLRRVLAEVERLP